MIKHHICPLFLNLFYLKDWVIVWEDQILFLFSEFISILSILFYNFIKFSILLYTFLVTSFSLYKKYMICLISIHKFSDVLPAFTCAWAIGNLWSIFLGLNILRPFSIFCFICRFRYSFRIIVKQFDNIFSWFVKCFTIFYSTFLLIWFFPCFYYLIFSTDFIFVV